MPGFPEKPAADKPKGKGALIGLMMGAPSGEGDDLSPSDHGFRAVAKAFGIPPEREASAQAALKQYIKTCIGSPEPDTDDLSEEY